jgi:hypothetical protein
MRYSNYLLQCSSGLYFFRMKVPDDLRSTIGKTEIKKSLKTYDTLTAQARAIRLMAVCKWNYFCWVRLDQKLGSNWRNLIIEM